MRRTVFNVFDLVLYVSYQEGAPEEGLKWTEGQDQHVMTHGLK